MKRILLLASTALLAACATTAPPAPIMVAQEAPPVPPPTVEVSTVPEKNERGNLAVLAASMAANNSTTHTIAQWIIVTGQRA